MEQFTLAIKEHYWYQCYLDDLPIWGMVGEVVGEDGSQQQDHDYYVYTRKDFVISYNEQNVIQVNLTSGAPVKVAVDMDVVFSYSVKWKKTQDAFQDRFSRYLDYSFFEHQIHWFSIFNSFMMVIFLCGLVALILVRTLRNDYAKYARDDDLLDGPSKSSTNFGDDSGWKQVHGDVFRAPRHLVLLSAAYG